MGPEGPHPEDGPDQINTDFQPEQDHPHTPERQRHYWWQLWRQRPVINPANDQAIRMVDEARQQAASDQNEANRTARAMTPEHMVQINTPEEAVELLSNITAAQYRERNLEERYGEGFGGRWRAFMAGEFDFHLNENGEIGRTTEERFTEFGRRAVRTLLNRNVFISTSIALSVGVLTGGMGLPAAAALAGGVAGRGVGEAWEALCGRRVRNGQLMSLRESAARLEFEDHAELQRMAIAIQAPDITDEERNHRIRNLVTAKEAVNERVIQRQREQIEENTNWNKRRDVCAKIGAGIGLVGGIWGSLENFMTMDINGIKNASGEIVHPRHLVESVNGQWNFAYDSVKEATDSGIKSIADLAKDDSDRLIHELGEPTWKVVVGAAKNLLPHIAQVFGVAGGMIAGRLWEKRGEADAMADFERDLAAEREAAADRSGFLNRQVPGHSEAFHAETPRERWTHMFSEDESRLPAPNDIWITQIGADQTIYRLNTVNFDNGFASVTQVDENLQPMVNPNTGNHVVIENFRIDDLARFGRRQDEAINFWARQFVPGSEIEIPNIQGVVIVDDKHRPVANNRYGISRNPRDPNMVDLAIVGEEVITAPAFQFFLWGINRIEPENPPAPPVFPVPVVNHVWDVDNRATLPTALNAVDIVPDTFCITRVTDQEFILSAYDATNGSVTPNTTRRLTLEQWQQIRPSLRETHLVVSGGNNPQPGGGGGRGGQGGGGAGGGNNPAHP